LFDSFIGQFARRPGVDGAAKVRRWRTGQVDDLDELLSGKAAGCARARRISQHGRDHRAQITGVVLYRGQLGLGVDPAAAPLAHCGQATP